MWAASCPLSWCPLVAGGRAFGVDPSFRAVFLAFVRSLALSFGGLLADMPLFSVLRGFLGGFCCWMYVCIACVPCVACGAFVCVRCLAVL